MSSVPEWKGLFDWSMQYQDGTRPTDWSTVEANPEKLKWLEKVMKQYMTDFTDRMDEMQSSLRESTKAGSSETDVDNGVRLLEELQDIVESIDFAKDLRSVGGLDTLKALLCCPHPRLRASAAEVLAACAQNHLEVQTWFLQEGVLDLVVQLLTDKDNTARAKGLLASSAITRGCKSALEAFCVRLKGMPKVVQLVFDEDRRLARKACEFTRTLCQAVPTVPAALVQGGGFLGQLESLLCESTSGSEVDVPMLATLLGLLLELVDDQAALQAIADCDSLQATLRKLRVTLDAQEGDDRDAVLEEIDAVDTILTACQTPDNLNDV